MSNSSTSSSTVILGIHGDPSYINFTFSFITFPMLFLFIPSLYIPITVVVVYKIFKKLLSAIQEKNVNVQLFTAITVSHILCLLFFVADFVYIRLPITGIFTSWCVSIQPNSYIVMLLVITYHINYSLMLLPFLVALIRVNLIVMPQIHQKVNAKLLKWSVPIVALYPFIFTSSMFPTIGYCQQAGYPLSFGSIIFRIEYPATFAIRNNIGLIFNTFFWLFACLIINSILIIKLIKLKFTLSQHAKSQMSHKAEISLTFTCLSMVFSYVTNGMIALGGILFPSVTMYLIVLRPFANDLDTCVVPWIFYLTHPVFKKTPSNKILFSSRDKVNS